MVLTELLKSLSYDGKIRTGPEGVKVDADGMVIETIIYRMRLLEL